jgi:uncharacterized protein (DUF58 family)
MADLTIARLVRRIQIYTNQLAKDLLAGAYRSAFKGRGLEFEEVRDYFPGDDVRTIDWPVTARYNKPVIKMFREERELPVFLVIDISASQNFGGSSGSKRELMTEVAAILAFSALKNNDKIGLIIFGKGVQKYIPPKKNLRHVIRIIREIMVAQPSEPGTNIGEALKFYSLVQHKTGICFLISDFMAPDYSHEASIIAKKHDLIAIQISDPLETDLPPLRLLTVEDLETGTEAVVVASNAKLQDSYKEKALLNGQNQKKLMRSLGAGYIQLTTGTAYIKDLLKFFRYRARHHR